MHADPKEQLNITMPSCVVRMVRISYKLTQRGLIAYERNNKRIRKQILAGGAYQVMLTVSRPCYLNKSLGVKSVWFRLHKENDNMASSRKIGPMKQSKTTELTSQTNSALHCIHKSVIFVSSLRC